MTKGMEVYKAWGGGRKREVPVVFKVLLVFSFITDTVLTLHTACPLWINYTALTNTYTQNRALTHMHTQTCMRALCAHFILTSYLAAI